MKTHLSVYGVLIMSIMISCSAPDAEVPEFQVMTEQFADAKILRYYVDGFENLSLQEKTLIYFLYEAALSGRDIIYDQNYKHNLLVRKTLETIIEHYSGDKTTDEWKSLLIYAKRVWFSNGIHHHYSNYKFTPEFTESYFSSLIEKTELGVFPLNPGESKNAFAKRILPIIFDPTIAPMKVSLDSGKDLLASSSVNFYEGVTQKEAELFYKKLENPKDSEPISHGLNSKLVKENGKLVERVWKSGGMYGSSIEKIVYWLRKAADVALNSEQKAYITKLAEYYETGDLKLFDEYSILWAKETQSRIDFINGFIETYNDPLHKKANWESIVSIRDEKSTQRIQAISQQAQWFEDNSSIPPQYKKAEVKGIDAKVITVVIEAGDAAPTTPIGINLPNANWIRENHGSKSVNLVNIVNAYNASSSRSGFLEEFAFDEDEIRLARVYGALGDNLHTDMHEVIGHASGKIKDGVENPSTTLKNYAASIEEARADLVALYFIYDQKLIDIGAMPSLEVGKSQYISYIRNGLMTQLTRLKQGESIQQAHMRNRQLVSKWVYEKGKSENIIEKVIKDGKTFFVIRDFEKLRNLFGIFLHEIQRITSEGDFEAAKHLIETYAVQVDIDIHKEALERYAKLNIAPYSGFIQPKLTPVMMNGKITDVKIEYPMDFTQQMLEYGKQYGFLGTNN